jgi:hypothetical protein
MDENHAVTYLHFEDEHFEDHETGLHCTAYGAVTGESKPKYSEESKKLI